MFLCPGCGGRYGAWLSRCGRCHYSPLLDGESIMAKITRLGGPSDKDAPEGEPQEAAVAATEAAGPDDAAEPSEAQSDEQAPESESSEDDEPVTGETGAEMPAVNALKSVWEAALLDAGVNEEWVYAEGRTKDSLVEVGRGLADGSVHLDAGLPYDGHGVEFT